MGSPRGGPPQGIFFFSKEFLKNKQNILKNSEDHWIPNNVKFHIINPEGLYPSLYYKPREIIKNIMKILIFGNKEFGIKKTFCLNYLLTSYYQKHNENF